MPSFIDTEGAPSPANSSGYRDHFGGVSKHLFEDDQSGHTWPKSTKQGLLRSDDDRISISGGALSSGGLTPPRRRVFGGGVAGAGPGRGGESGQNSEEDSSPVVGRPGRLTKMLSGGGSRGNLVDKRSDRAPLGEDRSEPLLSITLGGVKGCLPDVRWSVQQKRFPRIRDSGIVK